MWWWLLCTVPLWGIPALWVLFPIAIQYDRAKMGQGWWWWACLVFALPALVIDVVLNRTSLALVFGWPRWGEWTFSTHLKRLYWLTEDTWLRRTARTIVTILNLIAPRPHIDISEP